MTLDSITVVNYDSGWQGAAIHPQPRQRLGGAECVGFAQLLGRLLVADGMKILGGHYNDNGQLGIGGNRHWDLSWTVWTIIRRPLAGPELACNHMLPCQLRLRGRWHEVGCRPGHGAQCVRA